MNDEQLLRKVLRRIEEIVSDDFCADMECDLMFGTLKTEKEKLMAEKLGKVYMLSHAFGDHPCHASHDDWREAIKIGEEKAK